MNNGHIHHMRTHMGVRPIASGIKAFCYTNNQFFKTQVCKTTDIVFGNAREGSSEYSQSDPSTAPQHVMTMKWFINHKQTKTISTKDRQIDLKNR